MTIGSRRYKSIIWLNRQREFVDNRPLCGTLIIEVKKDRLRESMSAHRKGLLTEQGLEEQFRGNISL